MPFETDIYHAPPPICMPTGAIWDKFGDRVAGNELAEHREPSDPCPRTATTSSSWGRGLGILTRPETPKFSYNLVDPPERNTVRVRTGGWTAIRLKADNPGVWFIHFHRGAYFLGAGHTTVLTIFVTLRQNLI